MKARRASRVNRAAEQTVPPWVPVALLGMAVFLSPLLAGKLSPISDLSVRVLILMVAILWTAWSVRQGSISLPSSRVALLSGIFFVLLLVSALDSVSIHATLQELVNIACYLLIFLMVAGTRSRNGVVYGIVACSVLSALIVGAIGLREYMLTGAADWRTFSTFFNPDFLAGFMALVLPIALAWYFSETSLGITAVAGLSALLILANLLLTGSRFGSVAATGGVLVFILFALTSGSLRKRQLPRFLLFALLAVAIFLTMGRPLANRVGAVKAESHSGGFRIYTWKGAVRMAVAHPVNGTGLGTFETAYPRYALVGYTTLAHNSYLQTAAEAGPATAVALLVLLLTPSVPAAVSLVRRRVEIDSPSNKGGRDFRWMPEKGLMLCGLLGGIAASMARNLVDSDWYVMGIGVSFWALLGTLVALTGAGLPKNSRFRRGGATTALVILGILACATLLMLLGEMHYALGERAWADQDTDGAVYQYRQAARFDPLNAKHRRRLGQAYMMLAALDGDTSYAKNAELEVRATIRLEPGAARNYYQLGRVYEGSSMYDEAVRAFQAALERHPNNPELLLALAQACERAGRKEEALRTWNRMVGVENSVYEKVRAIPELVEPAYIFAHVALGEEFERAGESVEAKEEYRRALDRVAKYQESMEAMGAVLDAGGRRDFEMEEEVEEIRLDILRRLSNLP